jgi:hypothetical protein
VKDLSPIVLTSIGLPDGKLWFDTPLELNPKMDDSGEYLIIEDEIYDLFVFASDRETLKRELSAEFAFIWRTYVTGADRKLTDRAEKLRQTLTALCPRSEQN